jgi:membrane associated rhomboid family serine protease
MPAGQLNRFLIVYGVVPANFSVPTLVTSMFLHGSWSHVIGNMWYLWIFGDNVEDRLGHAKFLIFYLLCGIVATYAQVLVNPNSNVENLGASGAIAGVLGAYLIMFPGGRVQVMMGRGVIPMPAIVVIGFWAVLQLFSSFGAVSNEGGVAYMAHVGGFVAGLVLVMLFGGLRLPRLRSY